MARRQPQKKFQYDTLWKNNTVLGFIVGLVAGLLIAIIVAMIITRSPMPFNSKLSKQDKNLSSSASTPFSDPNQPMYGNRDAAKNAYKNATADAASDPSSAESEKPTVYLQAGAYREKADAENMRAKLALIGIEAQVTEVKAQNGSLYRVRLGPYTQSKLAATQNKLRENGIEFTTSRPG
ncbi:SPOR domain-containing protein [Oxalobacter sp. OttesenSCG-928-P03]|nr:SPOR domain-containing protein [Oxalobacter sp. OttesenSCG-928-P03]